jgi:hypothetical protein
VCDASSVELLDDCITHIAHYRRVQRLTADQVSSPQNQCRFELVGKTKYATPPPSYPSQRIGTEPVERASGIYEVAAGETVKILFKNNSDTPVYLTVFDLKHLWGIEQIYPYGSRQFEEVCGQQERPLQLQMLIPEKPRAKGRADFSERSRAS